MVVFCFRMGARNIRVRQQQRQALFPTKRRRDTNWRLFVCYVECGGILSSSCKLAGAAAFSFPHLLFAPAEFLQQRAECRRVAINHRDLQRAKVLPGA